MGVKAWLENLALEQHATAFAEDGVDTRLLTKPTNQDLKDLGSGRLAERKRLPKAIAALSGAPVQTNPEVPVHEA